MELFYPLTCDFVTILDLPESMMEYVNMCGQCVIGVVLEPSDVPTEDPRKNKHAPVELLEDPEQGSKRNQLFDIMQDNSCQIDLDKNHSI